MLGMELWNDTGSPSSTHAARGDAFRGSLDGSKVPGNQNEPYNWGVRYPSGMKKIPKDSMPILECSYIPYTTRSPILD